MDDPGETNPRNVEPLQRLPRFLGLFERKGVLPALVGSLFLRAETSLLMIVFSLITPAHTQPPAHMYSYEMHNSLQAGGVFSSMLLLPWYRWDTVHYLRIATEGYSTMNLVAWPPLYPALVGAGSILVHPLASGLLVSTLCLFVFLLLIYRFVAETWDDATARRTVVWIVVFPASFYLVAVYSESLYLALAVACFLAARRRRWLLAGLWGMLGTLVRYQGVALAAILLVEGYQVARSGALKRWQERLGLLGGLALVPLGLAGYFVYVRYSLGYPWPWEVRQSLWPLTWVTPWEGLLTAFRVLWKSFPLWSPSVFFDLVFTVLFLILLLRRTHKMPLSLAAMSWGILILMLTQVRNDGDLTMGASLLRYVLAIFPGFIILAQAMSQKWSKITWAVSFAAQILLLWWFYYWLWVA